MPPRSKLPPGSKQKAGASRLFFVRASDQLPPAETSLLVGDADPVLAATERRGKRPGGELRPVVLLAQVRRHQMLQASRIDLPQQGRRLLVLEMTEAPTDPLLEARRIPRRRQQRLIVVAFEYQAIAGSENLDDVWRDRTAVGEHAKAMRAIAKGVLDGFARIVRHGEGLDFEAANRKRRVTVDQPAFGQGRLAARGGDVRTVRQINREAVTAGKGKNPGDVVAVFVRHHDRRQLVGSCTQSGQARRRQARGKATVEQDLGLAGIDNQGVPLTAATQRSKADHFN